MNCELSYSVRNRSALIESWSHCESPTSLWHIPIAAGGELVAGKADPSGSPLPSQCNRTSLLEIDYVVVH